MKFSAVDSRLKMALPCWQSGRRLIRPGRRGHGACAVRNVRYTRASRAIREALGLCALRVRIPLLLFFSLSSLGCEFGEFKADRRTDPQSTTNQSGDLGKGSALQGPTAWVQFHWDDPALSRLERKRIASLDTGTWRVAQPITFAAVPSSITVNARKLLPAMQTSTVCETTIWSQEKRAFQLACEVRRAGADEIVISGFDRVMQSGRAQTSRLRLAFGSNSLEFMLEFDVQTLPNSLETQAATVWKRSRESNLAPRHQSLMRLPGGANAPSTLSLMSVIELRGARGINLKLMIPTQIVGQVARHFTKHSYRISLRCEAQGTQASESVSFDTQLALLPLSQELPFKWPMLLARESVEVSLPIDQRVLIGVYSNNEYLARVINDPNENWRERPVIQFISESCTRVIRSDLVDSHVYARMPIGREELEPALQFNLSGIKAISSDEQSIELFPVDMPLSMHVIQHVIRAE